MKFHIEQNVTPEHVRVILPMLSTANAVGALQIYQAAQQMGHRITYDYVRRNLKVLADLGLLKDQARLFTLSPSGVAAQALLRLKPAAFQDVMHFLFYTSWDITYTSELAFCWTYQTICNLLWDARPTVIQGQKLVADVVDLAQTRFPEQGRIALTDWAIEGAYQWLRALEPPFVKVPAAGGRRKTGGGRTGCSTELLLLAVDYLYRKLRLPYQSSLPLDEVRIRSICQLCLLDTTSFKETADATVKAFGPLTAHGNERAMTLTLTRPIRLEGLVDAGTPAAT